MVSVKEAIKRVLSPPPPIAQGIHHYRRDLADRQLRLHLRIEPDGSGLLSVNASGIIHLNETATLMMKSILDGADENQAYQRVRKHYKATREDVSRDYQRIRDLINHLETTEDACPIMNLDAPRVKPFGQTISAPYRVDLALTYECDNDCQHCYVARRSDEMEPMSLEQWKRTLRVVWDAGVPHVCFTGGEATLSPHLETLVTVAEDIGLITGLLSNGRKLADPKFVNRLVAAGLDHVQITLESHDPSIHDKMVGSKGAFQETTRGVKNALAEDIYLLTNTTLCELNADGAAETVAYLNELGVRQFAMNSLINTGKAPASGLGIAEEDLEPILAEVTGKASELGMRFIWYTPTHYCAFNPTSMGIGYKRCTAAEYSVCVEPDGSVIPCQSYYQPVGHILNDSWNDIWNSELFKKIRCRNDVDETCRGCPDFDVCGAGCPLSDGERFICSNSLSQGGS